MKKIKGKSALITSGNPIYNSYIGLTLKITQCVQGGINYDNSKYPLFLCSFADKTGRALPFDLYEDEFTFIN